jgi:energy-coupling factor transporter ATP-binding protein EcfA2
MLDFVKVGVITEKKGVTIIGPKFQVGSRRSDLMTKGGKFFAIFDERTNLWSTNEEDAQEIIDEQVADYISKHEQVGNVKVATTADFDSGRWTAFKKYVMSLSDNYHNIDEKLVFQNTEYGKKDYISKTLPYSLSEGPCESWNKIIGTLYSEEEREKIEWAIGAVISGDSKKIQKFLVFHGPPGSGKSTILNILQMLFDGYYCVFDSESLGNSNDAFSLEPFKDNPLVGIEHDGDLSKISTNTRLNMIVSHEKMTINEKFKGRYANKLNAFLFMGTNKNVQITDSKSGLIRRLIDVYPSGNLIESREYNKLMKNVEFELGAIAYHCLKVYENLGINYYNNYISNKMLSYTNEVYNFISDRLDKYYNANPGITQQEAWYDFKQYLADCNITYSYTKARFVNEFKEYFDDCKERICIDGVQYYRLYTGFRLYKFKNEAPKKVSDDYSDDNLDDNLDGHGNSNSKRVHSESKQDNYIADWLTLTKQSFDFESKCRSYPAQYANDEGHPCYKWVNVKTILNDINTNKLHFVKMPENHIVIDFDIKDERGEKSLERNLIAASKWPKTYAEVSKSGKGLHLHYIYDGDPKQLSAIYDENIEIKVFTGNSSLRRKLTKCNSETINHISSGLPLKGKNKVVDKNIIKNERILRTIIEKNLRKEYHGYTKPSIDFIYKVLDDAYNSGMHYDVSDLRPDVMAFANNSTNQAVACNRVVAQMKWHSDDAGIFVEAEKDSLVFYDVEVFPNLFVVCYKILGQDKVNSLINPTSGDIEELIKYNLVGFNNRNYDNHILYARLMGYTNEELYTLSQRIIEGSPNSKFGEAYNLSYTDIYDFSNTKQSLKKWEIALGIHHLELGIPWNEPVDKELWPKVAEYCCNDVEATEALYKHLKGDWTARRVLSYLSGLSLNDTTNNLTCQYIFGNNKHPQSEFIYTELNKMFPGYTFDKFKKVSMYKGEEVGEGGYVYSEPGIYYNVALLDITSMHPHSAYALKIFGDRYTERYMDLVRTRVHIKHGKEKAKQLGIDINSPEFYEIDEIKEAMNMCDGLIGKMVKELDISITELDKSLKVPINAVYGLTSAKFENRARDPRNIDNIVAKRGALFMINLKYEVQKRGFTVAHIKTDSIKIPNATPEIIEFVMEYGKKYGYNFEHEATYERMALVNDAVYIARYKNKDGSAGDWTATGAQFAVPYVFKTLFSREEIVFEDLCETKSCTTALYLDMNEGLDEESHNYHFVGKVGSFCPVVDGAGGGLLYRKKSDEQYANQLASYKDKYKKWLEEGKGKEPELPSEYAFVGGSKGYRWLEAEIVIANKLEDKIDKSYFNKLVDDAIETISQYGNVDEFRNQ